MRRDPGTAGANMNLRATRARADAKPATGSANAHTFGDPDRKTHRSSLTYRRKSAPLVASLMTLLSLLSTRCCHLAGVLGHVGWGEAQTLERVTRIEPVFSQVGKLTLVVFGERPRTFVQVSRVRYSGGQRRISGDAP